MVSQMPRFVDLYALAADLDRKKGGKELRFALDQAWRAQSCLSDLRQARDCCDVMASDFTVSSNLHRETIKRSLLMTGIGLYVRATSTSGKSGERGSIQLDEGRLTPDQRADHKLLIAIRKQALAHVRPETEIAAHRWHDEVFAAVEQIDGSWQTLSGTRQTGFHTDSYARLKRMAPVAHEIVLDVYGRRSQAVTDRFNAARPNKELFDRHCVDPVATFGSAEAVKHILSQQGVKETSFWSPF